MKATKIISLIFEFFRIRHELRIVINVLNKINNILIIIMVTENFVIIRSKNFLLFDFSSLQIGLYVYYPLSISFITQLKYFDA